MRTGASAWAAVAGAAAVATWAGCSAGGGETMTQPEVVRAVVHPDGDAPAGGDGPTYVRPPDAELRARLTPLQWHVTQEAGTERPFENAYHASDAPGIYVDVASGEPLFSSVDKFDSGCGWPAFSRPIAGAKVPELADRTHGMARVEVRSGGANSHLGHVFEDGPVALGGRRYCINSAALRFVPLAEMAAQGYQAHLQPFIDAGLYDAGTDAPAPPITETATFAGGCFWGMEELLRNLPGVTATEVGYTGGDVEKPRYEQVKTGRTGHAETVRIVFNPKQIGYADLLRWFFRMHDPTTPNRQGNDVGSQYRSVIFVHSAAQRAAAEAAKAEAGTSGRWKRPLVTEIVDAGAWWPAEDYHQDYLQANPGGYTCHWIRD